jgi:glycosyltransferase involved in cell wall biosynthesis
MLSVVIPVRNRAFNLEFCLSALEAQTLPREHWEVIISDDRSSDGTRETAFLHRQNLPGFKYLFNKNNSDWNASVPRNLGSRLVSPSSTHLLFLDADVCLRNDVLGRHWDSIHRNPDRVIIGLYHWLHPTTITHEVIISQFDQLLASHQYTLDLRMPSFSEVSGPDEIRSSLFDGLACFSGDTDLMTPSGIKNIKDFGIGDTVYSLNTETGETEIDEVIATVSKHFSGNLLYMGSPHSMANLLVTPDHRIFASKPKSSFRFYSAEDLLTSAYCYFPQWRPKKGEMVERISWREELVRFAIPYVQYHDGVGKPWRNGAPKKAYLPNGWPVKDFLTLLGYYIGDGFLLHGYGGKDKSPYQGVAICCKNNNLKREQIISLFEGLDIPWSEDANCIKARNHLLAQYLLEACGSGAHNKKIPEWIFRLDASLLEYLFTALMLTDGQKRGDGYATVSDMLSQQFLRLCFLLGKPAWVKHRRLGGHGRYKDNICYYIYLRGAAGPKRGARALRKQNDFFLNCTKIRGVPFSGFVYCITTKKNHTVLAGREGKFIFVGQCFSGHLVIPRRLFWKAGGYDENIRKGCEDGDFGLTLWELGTGFTFDRDAIGLHIYHDRPSDRLPGLDLEVKKLNAKHHMDIVYQTQQVYRKWGEKEWLPDPEYFSGPEEQDQWMREHNPETAEGSGLSADAANP